MTKDALPRLRRRFAGVAVVLLLAGAAPHALAHHSGAMFDPTKMQTITGTVRTFNWTNPHVNLELMADAAPGQVSNLWTLEGSSPGVMSRSGWTKRSLNPGDHVSVTVAPLKTGGFGGALRKVQFPDGRTLTFSLGYGPPADAPH